MSNVRMAFDGGRTRSPIADALATGPRVLKIWLNNRLLNKGYCPILVRAYHFLCTTYTVPYRLKKLEKVCNAQHTECRIFARDTVKEYTYFIYGFKRPQNKVLNRKSIPPRHGARCGARPAPTAPLTAARGDTC